MSTAPATVVMVWGRAWPLRVTNRCPCSSTSPANAAVPYPEKLRWFRELAELLDRPRG